jgi:hypothetical protein
MSLNANATPFKFSTECVIDMPHDVMLDYAFPYTLQADYAFPYTLQTDYIKEEVHPILGVSYHSLATKTPSYSCVLTRQPDGLYVPIYSEVRPWSSILSRL